MTNKIELLKTKVQESKNNFDVMKNTQKEDLEQTKIQEKYEEIKEIKRELQELKKDTPENINIQSELSQIEKAINALESDFNKEFSIQLDALKIEVKNNQSEKKDEEEKSWLREQRDGVTNKEEWKEHTLKNIGRTAMGVGAVALTWKGIKRLFGIGKNKTEKSEDNKQEKKEKSGSSWRKWLLGGGLLAAGGYGLYRILKGKELSLEDSLIQVEAELGTISEADEINIDRGNITYEESVKQIKSYNLGTKINTGGFFKAKKIDGLDISFSDYKQLIHAANLVNYIKHKYTGRCETDTPFTTKTMTGDIYINIKKGNNDIETEEIISGGIFSTLSNICPDVLNGIFKDTDNKQKFLAYLNKQGCWKEGDIQPPDPHGDKIQKQMNDIRQDIVDTPSEFDPLGKERGQIITTPGNTDKTEYIIQSRGNPAQETKIKMDVDVNGTIISGKIEGLEIKFTTVKELLRTANLVNKLKHQYHVAKPLLLEPNKKAFYRTSSFGLVGGHPGIYVDNDTTWTLDDRVIKKETLRNIFPTVLSNKERFIDYLNELKDENGKGLRER